VDQTTDKLGGDFTVVPVSPSALKICQGKEGSDCSLEGCKIGSTDAGIITARLQITFCDSEIALRFEKVVLPHITLLDAYSDGEI
jgi:hypothetical protein